jgi:tetratricopeptide (TPR) repeat protein
VGAEPNERLAALMEESCLSAKALARAVREAGVAAGRQVGCDHTSVSRWLAGIQPRAVAAQLLCEVLGRRLGRAVTPADAGLVRRPVVDPAAGLSYVDSAEGAVEILADLWLADLNDVSVVVSAPTNGAAWAEASLAWLVRSGRDEFGGRGGGAAVGVADVEALRATTQTFAAMDNRFGGRHARHALVQFLRSDLAPLLAGRYSEPVGRRLFAAAGEATLLAAWMSYDAGGHGLAQRYFIQGLRLAQAAEDVLLAGSVLDAMSHQATFLGRYREAARLARAARTGTQGAATATLQAHFAAMEARALAGAGDRPGTERVLAEVVRLFESGRPQDGPDWMAYFDEVELAAELAHCYRDLGCAADAVRYAEQALAGAGASQRSDFFVSMVLAAGQLAGGEVDRSCATVRQAVTLGSSVKSARAAAYLRQFRKDLSLHGPCEAAAALAADMQDNPLWLAAV